MASSGPTPPDRNGAGNDGNEGVHSPKPQQYWNISIRLFSDIFRTLIGRVLPSAEMQSVYSTTSADWTRQSFYKYI